MKTLRYFNLLAVIVLLASFLGAQPVAAQAGGDEVAPDAQYVPGEVVVGFVDGRTPTQYAAQASALAGSVGAQVVDAYANLALLSFAEEADVLALAKQLKSQGGVSFAEPNFVYRLPEPVQDPEGSEPQTELVFRLASKGMETEGKPEIAIPIKALQAMRSKVGNRVMATYPNDPYLWWNNGWSWVGADIVWPNTTASAGVCVLDTGVDYLHKDLAGQVIKGYDFVNDDTDPMDDFGHGTHVAGIIAANQNNKEGISGVSTGKVVAVKVLGSQGWGTNFDVAAGIKYCANRTDVRVLNLSLGGDYSTALYNAVKYAVNTKGKLVVAAAGNDTSTDPIYPAGFADTNHYPSLANKVLAVAASGQWYQPHPDTEPDTWWTDYNCQAQYSNYGSWVSVVAPGSDIYSTTPWDKPFYLNSYYGVHTRYSWLSGTSMATPFVAASAARRWGYKPLETNAQIGADVIGSGWEVNADGECWASEMAGKHQVHVADLLDRGAVGAHAYDASTGTPLDGATLLVYQGTTLRGSAVITPNVDGPWPWETDPTRVYMWFNAWTDVINLPVGSGYQAKINKAGYTTGPQAAYQHGLTDVCGGCWNWAGRTGVPPKSTNFEAVLGWWWMGYDEYNNPDTSDLDLNVWLPNYWLPDNPNPQDPTQPERFIVGPEGDDFGTLEGNPAGAMTAFPFARYKREGGWIDWLRIENTTISSRKAHAPLAGNAALPYYPGTYTIMTTDYGQTIDHDGDAGTEEIPLMGVYFVPHLYIWKDGVIKLFVDMMDHWQINPGEDCNAHWWKAAIITSGVGGAPTYTAVNTCGDDTIFPYPHDSSVTIGPDDPIHIAYALVVNGPDASLGIDSRNGVEIAIDDAGGKILGHDIQFDGQDDGCSGEGGLAAGRALAADSSIAAVIGTSCSSAARQAMPLLSEAGMVMVSPSNTAPDLTEAGNPNNYPGYLRTAVNDKLQSGVAAQYAWETLGVTSAATIRNGYTDWLEQVFAEAFTGLGGTITAQEVIDPSETDFSSVLTSIASGNPDLIYLPIFLPAAGYIITQARNTSGLETTYLMGGGGLYTPDEVIAAGDDIEGFMVTSPDFSNFSPDYYNHFLPAYQAKFGYNPINMTHAHAYDAFMIIKAAIEQVAVVDPDGTIRIDRQALRDALYDTTDFPGLTGNLTCSATGDCAAPNTAIYRYHAGQYPPEQIWPYWREEFNAGFLDPDWYWVNQNPSMWNLTEQPGSLRIYTSPGATGGENLLLRPVEPGNFVFQTFLRFEPTTNFQIAGLVIYQDGDNFLQFGRAFCDPSPICVGNGIYFDYIEGGSRIGDNFATATTVSNEALLRVERSGNEISAYYSEDDGVSWIFIGTHTMSGSFVVNAVGLTSSQNYFGPPEGIPADFDYAEFGPLP